MTDLMFSLAILYACGLAATYHIMVEAALIIQERTNAYSNNQIAFTGAVTWLIWPISISLGMYFLRRHGGKL